MSYVSSHASLTSNGSAKTLSVKYSPDADAGAGADADTTTFYPSPVVGSARSMCTDCALGEVCTGCCSTVKVNYTSNRENTQDVVDIPTFT